MVFQDSCLQGQMWVYAGLYGPNLVRISVSSGPTLIRAFSFVKVNSRLGSVVHSCSEFSNPVRWCGACPCVMNAGSLRQKDRKFKANLSNSEVLSNRGARVVAQR
ncbi:hypothetical protein H1C71_022629 [Ictidomys tridecemlineatus]|nr:hypothetical protein H1C71_022629 [Ictidomys tridecemlineatus]KAG3269759.1 hypothetical protein H1C71_022629 [Ictidomys tridecemlineatus]